jgi:Raf kinase inhibitor-like YbhB/YbcL family protein
MVAAKLRSALIVLLFFSAGCSGPVGRSVSPSPISEVAVETTKSFSLMSTAFDEGGGIPRRFTCDGENVSPDLNWTGAPEGTAAFVLLVDDPDAHDFTHWVAFDLTGSSSGGLPEAVSGSPDAPPQGLNDFGKVGYGGPCPPSGQHHYRFTLYALDRMLELTGTPKFADVKRAMVDHVIGQTTLSATYARR